MLEKKLFMELDPKKKDGELMNVSEEKLLGKKLNLIKIQEKQINLDLEIKPNQEMKIEYSEYQQLEMIS